MRWLRRFHRRTIRLTNPTFPLLCAFCFERACSRTAAWILSRDVHEYKNLLYPSLICLSPAANVPWNPSPSPPAFEVMSLSPPAFQCFIVILLIVLEIVKSLLLSRRILDSSLRFNNVWDTTFLQQTTGVSLAQPFRGKSSWRRIAQAGRCIQFQVTRPERSKLSV